MKKLYILGILVSLFILTNVASAAIDSQYIGKTYVLDQDSASGNGVAVQYVTATIIDSTTVQFHVVGKGSYATGYFKEIGLPLSMHIPTLSGNPTTGAVSNEAGALDSSEIIYVEHTTMDGLQYPMGSGNINKIYFNDADLQNTGINGGTQQYYDTITVKLTAASTFNPTVSTTNDFGAHLGFPSVTINGVTLDSAWFAGITPVTPSTQVPEFPSMALPVAGIMGLMFIFGNRKKE